MPRTHGYAPRGKACRGEQNWNAKGRVNIIGALAGKTLLTLALFDVKINADIVFQWLKQEMLPKLEKASVIVMDNATFHKREDIKYLIQSAGHILQFLPAYSPDLNPVEHKWAQAKAFRRKTGLSVQQTFKVNQFI